MKKIDKLLEVGYCQHGYVITAENLQKWAYNQLVSAPDLLKACKQCADPMGLPVSLTPEETLIQIRRLLRQAIAKAEGK